MEGPVEVGEECTLEFINENKLPQDHPCVIKLIRQLYLNPPSPRDVPYNFTELPGDNKHARDGTDIQNLIVKQKKNGFFVECGAFDGLFLANTLDLEKEAGWTGLLIEASPPTYKALLTRNRKAMTSNVCLSLMPYPTQIDFIGTADSLSMINSLFHMIETDKDGKKLYNSEKDKRFGFDKMSTVKIQCFPFYSLLLAANQTTVDFFSLDIEGHEKRILETIPWEKVDIKAIRVETEHIPPEMNKNGSEALKEFMEGEPGYLNFRKFPSDEFYIQNPIH